MTTLSNKQVSERIRTIRKSKNITQTEVAEQLGMTKSNYAKYERGERTRFDRELLINISRILGCPISDIVGFDDNDELSPNTDASRNIITRQSLKDNDRILLSHLGELSDEEQEFFRKQIERAAKERKGSYDD